MNYFIYSTVILFGSTIWFFLKWREIKVESEKRIKILEADARECTKGLNAEVAKRIGNQEGRNEIDLLTKY